MFMRSTVPVSMPPLYSPVAYKTSMSFDMLLAFLMLIGSELRCGYHYHTLQESSGLFNRISFAYESVPFK
jgi:hypothetical protein